MIAKYCRDKAKRCIELANATQDVGTQQTLFELAKGWLDAAGELDKIAKRADELANP
jgi:hypothetical protein